MTSDRDRILPTLSDSELDLWVREHGTREAPRAIQYRLEQRRRVWLAEVKAENGRQDDGPYSRCRENGQKTT